jgi:hypothetical protein
MDPGGRTPTRKPSLLSEADAATVGRSRDSRGATHGARGIGPAPLHLGDAFQFWGRRTRGGPREELHTGGDLHGRSLI